MDKNEIGVGPHPEPWPTDEKYDKDLLEAGDRRNVVDKYRYWTNQAIKEDMQSSSHKLEVAIENHQHDFNIGTIVRNANAFNVSKVHIIGRRQWNKRGAMVTNRYLEVVHHESVEGFCEAIGASREIIAIDNQPGAENLTDVELPPSCVLVFGGEGPGLSQEMIEASSKMIQIEQFGSTRSVNVGVASGIVMYQWLRENSL
ncbi:MAG: rRNA methyltransferase [bacterium]|nr:rRNA methyltransferase [bacterium]MDN5835081.1 rRNA methyltransferase [bacterium]